MIITFIIVVFSHFGKTWQLCVLISKDGFGIFRTIMINNNIKDHFEKRV